MKQVYVNPKFVKNSKELDNSNLNKNNQKALKTIVALVNEGCFAYSYILFGIYVKVRNLSNLFL